MCNYFYGLLRKYLSLFILPQNSAVELDPATPLLVAAMPHGRVAFRHASDTEQARQTFPENSIIAVDGICDAKPDFLVLSGLLHYERDIQELLANLHAMCDRNTRIVIVYYSALWRPFVNLASKFGIRARLPVNNWLAHEDIQNLVTLTDFEIVRLDSKILLPIYVPIISHLLNRYVAPLPVFRALCLVNIAVARVATFAPTTPQPSVSIVVPARNEAGNIELLLSRVPKMGPNDEIIFVEGGSTDNTWQVIEDVNERHRLHKRITIARQTGRGKGDAVRTGFELAQNEILMILDADMAVPPECLPKFYAALLSGKGEFINGSRLVYPMDKEAMRFLNLLANKFFAVAFSFVLGQRFKDTLCGTKAITRINYEKLASTRSYFGNFDPFGDFDLIFGAARMALKIIEVPINYQGRVYGTTNISRWRHGAILIAMLFFAMRKIKFI